MTDVRDAPRLAYFAGWRTHLSLRTHGVYAALGLIIAFNVVFTPNFATLSNLRLQLVQVTPVVIVALGMAVVVATGGIDLSVGAVMALAAATLAALLDHGPWSAMAAALGAGLLAGVFNGLLVGVVRVQPIVATLGLFIAGRGLALMIADGRLTEIFDPTIRSMGSKQLIGGLQTGVLVAIGLALSSAWSCAAPSSASGWWRSAAARTRPARRGSRCAAHSSSCTCCRVGWRPSPACWRRRAQGLPTRRSSGS